MTPLSRIARLSCLALLLLGCGGGGGGHHTTTAVATVYAPQTVVLAASDARKVTDNGDGTVTVTGDTSAITVGSIIASGQGQGLLRRVTALAGSGTFVTEQATLEDAIQTADVTDKRTIGAAQVASFIPGGDGITLDSRARDFGGGAAISLTLARYELYKGTDSAGNEKSVTLTGKLKLSVDLDNQLKLGFFRIDHFSSEASIKAEATAELQGEISTELANRKTLLGTIVGLPFEFIPGVVVTPVIRLYSVLDGKLKTGFTLTSEISATAHAGIALDSGRWSTSHGLDKTVKLTPDLDLATSLVVSYTPARCELQMLIDGVVGPYVDVDAPRLEGELALHSNPSELEFTAKSVYDAEVGVKASIFGEDLLDQSFPLPLEEELTILDVKYPLNANGGVTIK